MIKVGQATVDLVQGDIADLEVDAIVNAANNALWMGAGVAGAIKRKGGAAIEEEAVAQGPIAVGEAVVTSGGALKARHVVHAAGMGQDLKTDADKVAASTRNSLLRAEEKGIRSIAFPAIGTGVGGLSVHLCAKTMVDVVVDHLLSTDAFDQVHFALFDEATYTAFHDYLLDKFSARS
ncbi:MAG: macro domain-containing protein [Candidatus Latescibacteria bacterium]|jgi:O-acetyl-ADP-ribose deacetylase (regulator of RNase III)|nr:macro domain-containing protein [Candidatus Latescibacterota bacterium]